MAHDWPELPDLLKTVEEFLDQLGPRLEEQDRYHALCSIYLLNIAQRELKQWRPLPSADLTRLAQLRDDYRGLDSREVIARLCRDIRSGSFDDELDSLLPVLHEHVVAKVRVSRPEHLAAEERE